MTGLLQVYRCNICGNIVEVLHTGAGTLVCCGQPMELLKEKVEDVGKEKHVPVIERAESWVSENWFSSAHYGRKALHGVD